MRALVAAVAAAAVLATMPAAAHADRTESADTSVSRLRVTYVEPFYRSRLYVELNDGSAYRFRPCTFEDGSGQPAGCYWDASDRGNGYGRSFVVLPSNKSSNDPWVYVYSRMVGDAR